VEAVLTGLIGVAATLLGSLTTYLFQARTAERTQAFERGERRRQEQADAFAAFAAAVTELKRALITLWLHREDPDGKESRQAHVECDRLGAATETARFRVQLISGDPELMKLADAAFKAAGALSGASGRTELRTAEDQFEAAVKAFIGASSVRLRAASVPSLQRPA
jgi:hypothetical protein